jgi:hypothetical protein
MSFLKIIAGANVLAFSLGLFMATDANAQYFGFGTGRNHLSAVQEQTRANLDNQRAVMENKITAALNTGQINRSQAASMRAQLDANRNAQVNAIADGFLSVAETQNLINGMNSIDTSLSSLATVGVTNTYGVTYGPGFGRDLNAQLSNLSSRLERNRSNGRLSNVEYRALRGELNRLNTRLARLNMGGLSRFERNQLRNQIDQFQMHFNTELNDRNGIATRGWYF